MADSPQKLSSAVPSLNNALPFFIMMWELLPAVADETDPSGYKASSVSITLYVVRGRLPTLPACASGLGPHELRPSNIVSFSRTSFIQHPGDSDIGRGGHQSRPEILMHSRIPMMSRYDYILDSVHLFMTNLIPDKPKSYNLQRRLMS